MAVVWCPLLPTALNLLVSRDCLSLIGPTSVGQWESRSSPSTRSIKSNARARNRTTTNTSRTNEESTPTTSTTNISTRSQALSAWLAYPIVYYDIHYWFFRTIFACFLIQSSSLRSFPSPVFPRSCMNFTPSLFVFVLVSLPLRFISIATYSWTLLQLFINT